MEQTTCVICNVSIETFDNIDIQLTTTEHGNINIEEFIKESILGLHGKTELNSKYLCKLCYETINQLEDYLIKSKSIQEMLLSKYLENNDDLKLEKPDIASNFSEDSDILQENKLAKEDSVSEEIQTENQKLKQRKSPRKIKRRQVIDSSDDNEDTEKKPKVRTRRKNTNKKETSESVASVDNESDESMAAEDKDDTTEGKTVRSKRSKQTKYCCEVCGKVTDRGNAAKHMNTHTHKKLFTCEYCNWQFTQNGDLQRHLRLHKGIFPYQCEYCPKRFAHHTSFDIHLKNHLGKRDHVCVICGRGLLSQSHLTRHMKTHTGEKEFACEICGKTCAEKSNLKKHMQIHMKQKTAADS